MGILGWLVQADEKWPPDIACGQPQVYVTRGVLDYLEYGAAGFC